MKYSFFSPLPVNQIPFFWDGRESFYTSDNPLEPFGERFQCQRQNFQYVLPNDSSNFHIQGTMIQLTRLPNGDAEFYIGLQTRAGGFFSDDIFTISSLNNMETETKIIAGRTFTDVVVFSAQATGMSEDDFPGIQKIWWSKRNGVVKYESKQGEVWTLNLK